MHDARCTYLVVIHLVAMIADDAEMRFDPHGGGTQAMGAGRGCKIVRAPLGLCVVEVSFVVRLYFQLGAGPASVCLGTALSES